MFRKSIGYARPLLVPAVAALALVSAVSAGAPQATAHNVAQAATSSTEETWGWG